MAPFGKLFVGEHTIYNEDPDVVPFLFKLLTFVFEDLLQFVGHLFADVT
jgi:hypothetical protein